MAFKLMSTVFCNWCEVENAVEINSEVCPNCFKKGHLVDVENAASKTLIEGSVFEDSNENTFKVISTVKGFELFDVDASEILENDDIYIFETTIEIIEMFEANNNPIEIKET